MKFDAKVTIVAIKIIGDSYCRILMVVKVEMGSTWTVHPVPTAREQKISKIELISC